MRQSADESMMLLAENLSNPNAGNDKLYVTFGLHPRQNEAKTLEQGRPIFDDLEYVKIIVPGDKQNEVHRPANDADRRMYRNQYAAFKAGNADAQSGTPLTEWPAITRAQVEELRYFKVHTVEQLGNLSDASIMNIGPIRALVSKAKDYLERAAGNAPMEKMRAELSQRDNELAALKQALKEQGDKLDQITRGSNKK
jgi:hypothetical protein